MTQAAYDQQRSNFTNEAHQAAKQTIYPRLFPNKHVTFENTLVGTNTRNDILDGQLGIDCIARVHIPNEHAPIPFTIQERFRDPQYQSRQDVTIRKMNPSGELSEMYKIASMYFVYGYYNRHHKKMLQAIAINTAIMMRFLALGRLPYRQQTNGVNQTTFITINFADLRSYGAIEATYDHARDDI
jgi:hypothetical protein